MTCAVQPIFLNVTFLGNHTLLILRSNYSIESVVNMNFKQNSYIMSNKTSALNSPKIRYSRLTFQTKKEIC